MESVVFGAIYVRLARMEARYTTRRRVTVKPDGLARTTEKLLHKIGSGAPLQNYTALYE